MDKETTATTPEESTTHGESDPLDASAKDFVGTTPEDMEEIQTDEDEAPKRDPRDVDDAQADEDDDEQADSEEDAESEDGDGEDAEVPRLDTGIENALKEHAPELIERWNEQWKGVLKREKTLDEFEDGIRACFEDPERAKAEVLQFVVPLAQRHGMTVEQLLGIEAGGSEAERPEGDEVRLDDSRLPGRYDPQARDDYGHFIPEWQQRGLDSAGELLALKRVAALEERDAKREAEAEARRAESEKTAKQEAYVEKVATSTIKVLEKTYPGFKVTKEMIGKAIAKFPQLEGQPIEAVEAAYARQIAQHTGRLAQENAGRGRVMPDTRTAKGRVLPDDPADWKAADVYAAG